MNRARLKPAETIKSVVSYRDFLDKTRAMNDEYLSPIVGAHNEDTLIIKQRANALSTREVTSLEMYLDTIEADTILVGGVSAYACIYRTLKEGALKGRFNLIAVGDSIDSIDSVQSYTNNINEDCLKSLPQGGKLAKPIQFTNTQEIAYALST